MRISDWSSDVCSSDLLLPLHQLFEAACRHRRFAFLLRLPGGKAQIILALLLLGADPVKNGKRDYLIVLLQRHAPNTCRGAALEFAHISGGEANGLALPSGEQHVVALSQQCDPDQAIGCAL